MESTAYDHIIDIGLIHADGFQSDIGHLIVSAFYRHSLFWKLLCFCQKHRTFRSLLGQLLHWLINRHDLCSFYDPLTGFQIGILPNDRYLLENEKFRLYYTAEGDEAHNFIVVVEDNFNNSYELEFDFNNRNVKDDGVISVVPIGNFKPLTR